MSDKPEVPQDLREQYERLTKQWHGSTAQKRYANPLLNLIGRIACLESELSALREKYAFEENQELCIGFDGGCDGDLVATPHNDNCPAQARDRVLNPHLYDAARAAEGGSACVCGHPHRPDGSCTVCVSCVYTVAEGGTRHEH